ncbi:MAG TPA: SRPBCC domain-containing protein [Gemmatimonadaceae bacterium]|nr:SRPBCC domain-containing protein [Gemmatimonadaceae bacterium]
MWQRQNDRSATVTLPSDREIVITRAFDAPRTLVFDAWTKPEHVTQWWDPSRAPLAACEIDLREGGAFRFVPAGPNGVKRSFAGIYRAIDPPSELVFTTPSPSGGESIGRLLFRANGDTTTLTMTIECASRADRDALLQMRVDAGTIQTLDNLDEHIHTLQNER